MTHSTTDAMPAHTAHAGPGGRAYGMLAFTFVLHTAIMYVLMFAMIDRSASFVNNANMLYMAALMAAPMTAMMPVTMPDMYPDWRLRSGAVVVALLVGALAFAAIRGQWGIGDRQFLRSMIPHHAGAILMCSQAQIADPRVQELCQGIVESQQREIVQMKALLQE